MDFKKRVDMLTIMYRITTLMHYNWKTTGKINNFLLKLNNYKIVLIKSQFETVLFQFTVIKLTFFF